MIKAQNPGKGKEMKFEELHTGGLEPIRKPFFISENGAYRSLAGCLARYAFWS